jgi:hypothetical protein
LKTFYWEVLKVKKSYSSKGFAEFWKKRTKADERRRLRDIRLPFDKKIEILGELMEEAILFDRVRSARRRIRINRSKKAA